MARQDKVIWLLFASAIAITFAIGLNGWVNRYKAYAMHAGGEGLGSTNYVVVDGATGDTWFCSRDRCRQTAAADEAATAE
jgi:hypothetical protein